MVKAVNPHIPRPSEKYCEHALCITTCKLSLPTRGECPAHFLLLVPLTVFGTEKLEEGLTEVHSRQKVTNFVCDCYRNIQSHVTKNCNYKIISRYMYV